MNKKKKTIASILLAFIPIVFTIVIILKSVQAPNIEIDSINNQVEISGGLYGKTIDIDQDTVIQMIDPIEITQKTNGAAIGHTKRGYFKLEDDSKVYLNLGNSNHKWIAITDDENKYYINLKDEDDTLALYEQLLDLLE